MEFCSKKLLVEDGTINDALFRINKSLNCRFENDYTLYIDSQKKYEIKKMLVNEAWQGIYNGLYKTDNISANILTTEILRNCWLIKNNISEKDYKSYLEPILDNTDNEIFYVAMEDILTNKIQVLDKFKLLFLEKYYSRVTKKELRQAIKDKNKYLKNFKIAELVLKRVFTNNTKFVDKLNSFLELYNFSIDFRANEEFIKKFFEDLINKNDKNRLIIINFIMENFIEKNSENESFWIGILKENKEEILKFLKEYSLNKDLDRYVLRSLLSGIVGDNIKNLDLKEESIELIKYLSDNSKTNIEINKECDFFIRKIEDEVLKEELLEYIGKNYWRDNYWRDNYDREKFNDNTDDLEFTEIENIDKILKQKELYNRDDINIAKIILSIINLKLSERKEKRLNNIFIQFTKIQNKNKFIDILSDNIEKNNFLECLLYISLKGDQKIRKCILFRIVKLCEKNESNDLIKSFQEFIEKNEIREEVVVKYLKINNFTLFKKVYNKKL